MDALEHLVLKKILKFLNDLKRHFWVTQIVKNYRKLKACVK